MTRPRAHARVATQLLAAMATVARSIFLVASLLSAQQAAAEDGTCHVDGHLMAGDECRRAEARAFDTTAEGVNAPAGEDALQQLRVVIVEDHGEALVSWLETFKATGRPATVVHVVRTPPTSPFLRSHQRNGSRVPANESIPSLLQAHHPKLK